MIWGRLKCWWGCHVWDVYDWGLVDPVMVCQETACFHSYRRCNCCGVVEIEVSSDCWVLIDCIQGVYVDYCEGSCDIEGSYLLMSVMEYQKKYLSFNSASEDVHFIRPANIFGYRSIDDEVVG